MQLCNNLGLLYLQQKKYAEAEQFFTAALEVFAKIAADGTEMATVLQNLGVVAHNRSDYPRAEEFHRRALDIRKVPFGESSEATSESRSKLGVIYRLLKQFPESEDCLKLAATAQ